MSMGEIALVNNAMKAGADMYVSPHGLLVPRLAAAARMALGAFCRPVSDGGGGLDNGLLRFHEEAGCVTRRPAPLQYAALNLWWLF